jgi:predicted CXXCH cytochrome family protein
VEIAIDAFGMGTIEDFAHMAGLSNVAEHPTLSPPHVLDLPNRCGRCHSMDGAPNGMLTSAGQENLCQSCHSAGKIAGKAWVGPGNDLNSHPWGVVPDDLDPQSDLALHLDGGEVRCGTCHEPHVNQNGLDFMRIKVYDTEDAIVTGFTPPAPRPMTVMDPTLCGECHADIVSQWQPVGHAEIDADPWVHYDWGMGNNWLCTGPGTPYDYCTAEFGGTVTSPANAICVGAGNPLVCCTGAGTGTCAIANASCTGLGTPYPCCLGAGTGNCIANSACTGAGTPSPCCTGVGAGTCSNSLPAAMCIGPSNPNPCCTAAGAGSCSDRSSCRQCHTGNGYVSYAKDVADGAVVNSTHGGKLRVVDCLVCHATHGTSQDETLLRIYDDVRFPPGQVLTGNGPGATCMACTTVGLFTDESCQYRLLHERRCDAGGYQRGQRSRLVRRSVR